MTWFSGHLVWREMIALGRSPKDVCCEVAGVPALKLVSGGVPVIQVARNLGISESCLRRWMAQDAVDTGAADGITSAEKRELVELRRKNRVLEMEVEILKRASAYFARENVLPL